MLSGRRYRLELDARCIACGHRDHADVSAAKNILNAAGHAVSGRGDLGTGRSVKRQPPATRTRTGRSPRAARAAGIPVLQHGEEVNDLNADRLARDGEPVRLRARSLCVHGDTPGAAELACTVRVEAFA